MASGGSDVHPLVLLSYISTESSGLQQPKTINCHPCSATVSIHSANKPQHATHLCCLRIRCLVLCCLHIRRCVLGRCSFFCVLDRLRLIYVGLRVVCQCPGCLWVSFLSVLYEQATSAGQFTLTVSPEQQTSPMLLSTVRQCPRSWDQQWMREPSHQPTQVNMTRSIKHTINSSAGANV